MFSGLKEFARDTLEIIFSNYRSCILWRCLQLQFDIILQIYIDVDISEKDILEEVHKSGYLYTYGKDKTGAYLGNVNYVLQYNICKF